ncbi:MAG: sulfurtransferase TusA family protein [Chromatiales bacterium]|nr:sulfurtransferase TusA family protein [Chromatiales bacterium]
MQTTTRTLDARGLNCPLPILRTRKLLAQLAAGETLTILATDPGSVRDMEAFCGQTGNALVSSESSDDGFRFVIRKPEVSA